MNQNQTVIEWLKEKIKINLYRIYNDKFWNRVNEIFEKQIKNAFNQGYTQCSIENLEVKSRERFIDAEDYFNKTFNKKELKQLNSEEIIKQDKNLYLLLTEKPSRLWKNNLLQGKLELSNHVLIGSNTAQHIYITCHNEDINENDYVITKDGRLVQISYLLSKDLKGASKIILTTDPELIQDSIQAIDNEFLEWFVKNPSCEEIEIQEVKFFNPKNNCSAHCKWEIITHKKETLEEAAAQFAKNHSIYPTAQDDTQYGFINGAKWQAEKMYSEEEVFNIIYNYKNYFKLYRNIEVLPNEFFKWFKKFKKK